MFFPKVVDLQWTNPGPDPNEPDSFQSGFRYDRLTKTRKTNNVEIFLSRFEEM
jgi:hypothetical protein